MISDLMAKTVSLAKRRGFIYPSSEIYGGFGSCYDYGPLGVELKNNIKNEWREEMTRRREDIVGLDAAILMSPKVWQASGHLTAGFADPLVECKKCHKRFRLDEIASSKPEILNPEQIQNFKPPILKNKCPDCGGELTGEKKFNLMMKTFIGPVEDEAAITYLRAETCQGIYVNYKNVLDSIRLKIPFGIAQIGKAFRNEITPGNFTYRTREFEQMEMQFFIKPGENEKWFDFWKEERMKWYLDLGIKKENLRFKEHKKEELSHYARAGVDIEYKFPFGWSELEGIHDRGDWDLSNHGKHSVKDLSYFDEEKKEKFIPHIIETSAGADRSTLAFLLENYYEEKDRIVLKFPPKLAPIKMAVFPLLANKPALVEKAREVYKMLKVNSQQSMVNGFMVAWDDRGNIGKRYYSQDEIGTLFCVTIDFQTLEDDTVTLRARDTMKQERVKIENLCAKKLF